MRMIFVLSVPAVFPHLCLLHFAWTWLHQKLGGTYLSDQCAYSLAQHDVIDLYRVVTLLGLG
jgi:hypothetical protein